MLQIGDKVMRMPTTLIGKDGKRIDGPISGTVVYIHPRGRFHVVRFDFKFGGFCESFLEVDQ